MVPQQPQVANSNFTVLAINDLGNDFSKNVSPANPGAFVLNQGKFYDPASSQPRVRCANGPGDGSCHTGDATSNLARTAGTLVNRVDTNGNADGIRLRQAYRTGDAKATPIVPANKRFAEPAIAAAFNGFANPGAGNPRLYRGEYRSWRGDVRGPPRRDPCGVAECQSERQ